MGFFNLNIRKVKTIFPLALGVLVLWLLYKDTNMAELWRLTKSANFYIIGYSLLFGLAGNIFRALRWELTIQSVGYYPKRMSLMYAVMGNYAVNFLLPRAGEVWRCGVITKYDKVPFSTTFGTLIVDRFFDVVAMGFIMMLCLLLDFNFFFAYFQTNPAVASALFQLLALLVLRYHYWFCNGVVHAIEISTQFYTYQKDATFYNGMKRDILTVGKWIEKDCLFYIHF